MVKQFDYELKQGDVLAFQEIKHGSFLTFQGTTHLRAVMLM